MEILEIKQTEKQLDVREAMLSGSKIVMACINDSFFNDISATNLKIVNANLSDLEIEGAQLGGAYMHNIGMPPEDHPAYDPNAKQRPLKFENCDLNGSTITNCDLSNIAITDSNIEGMTINGLLVSNLLAGHKA